MESSGEAIGVFEELPDPGRAGTLDDLIERLRLLKVWAGDPSYEWITGRVNAAWTAAGRPPGELVGKTTVVSCFRPGRRRVNTDLLVAVVAALHPDVGYVAQWRQALQVIAGRAEAAAQVRVLDGLPSTVAGFTGRTAELDELRQALGRGAITGGVTAIAGMAGVGKTQLAIHAGHIMAEQQSLDRVLFVNLRGFHPDPTQPPADPSAVLDGFLRQLGVPGQQIPHDLPARAALYRKRFAGTRTLIVLDNAADARQVRPLLPDTPGCPVLVTSRRSLTDLRPATHLIVDVFTATEAHAFLAGAAADVPVGPDPHAPARIAGRCGHLPLALGLVAAHIRGNTGWTLTDHANRLDERHHQQRLDTGVELALDLSYQRLPTDRKRLLRVAALHPGQDFDSHCAAALIDTDLPTAQSDLDHLVRDHLMQPAALGRYTLHDLVRGYATGRASDEDPPLERRAALTRLFDYYLAMAANAMDVLYPGDADSRPRVPRYETRAPALTDPDTARIWLDTERSSLVAIVAHTATHGWPGHTTRLSATLARYLAGGYHTDALTVYTHAHHAAQEAGEPTGQADALTNLGVAYGRQGRYEPAIEHFRQALELFQHANDPVGQARVLHNLGTIEGRLGRYQPAADYHEQALTLFRQIGDDAGEALTLTNLGILEQRLGRQLSAADHHKQALTLFRRAADHGGEVRALTNLADVEMRLGRHRPATDHLQQALALARQLGDRTAEAQALDRLGTLHTLLSQPSQAAQHHQQALAIFRETGDHHGQGWALNGVGEAAHAAGHPDEALVHHADAHAIAGRTGDRHQLARAHAGLARAHDTLGDSDHARHHYKQALAIFADVDVTEAERIRAQLAAVDETAPNPRDPNLLTRRDR